MTWLRDIFNVEEFSYVSLHGELSILVLKLCHLVGWCCINIISFHVSSAVLICENGSELQTTLDIIKTKYKKALHLFHNCILNSFVLSSPLVIVLRASPTI